MAKRFFRKLNDFSLFQKTMIFVFAIIIVPVLIAYLITIGTTEKLIVEQTSHDSMNSVYVVASNVENSLKRIAATMLSIYNDDSIQKLIDSQEKSGEEAVSEKNMLQGIEINNSIERLLSNTLFNAGEFNAFVTMYTLSGNLYTNYASNKIKLQQELMAEYPPEALLKMDKSIIWKGIEKNYPMPDDANNPYVITMTKTLDNSLDGSNKGILLMSLKEKFFRELLSSEESQAVMLMLDGGGNIISSSDEKLLGKSFRTLFHGTLQDDNRGCLTFTAGNGQKSLLTYQQIRLTSWTIIELRPYASITKKISQTNMRLLLINLACIFFFLIFAYGITAGITNPLKRLSNMMLSVNLENVSDQGPAEDGRISGKEAKILKGSFDIMRKRIKDLINENKNEEKRKREAELNALQAQISPHFLFNTLNTIRCAAINGNTDKVADMVLALSNLLKMTIVKQDELITLTQEIENLRNYITILKMRHSVRYEVNFDIDGALMDYPIPKLLLQPLVENAVLHGFESMKKGGVLNISARVEEEFTIVSILDNGKGLDRNPLDIREVKSKKLSGIGVSNVDERIRLYYGDQYGLRFMNNPGGGTCVEVLLPVRESRKDAGKAQSG
jgi:two-component system sensor histidine kinase YesM